MKNIKTFSELKITILMIIAIVSWAFAFPFIKIALEDLSYINLTLMRFFFVCLIFIIIFIVRKEKISKLHRKDIIPIFLLGFFGLIVYHLGLNYGEQFVSPSVASLIIATIPIQIVILAAIFLKEKINLKISIGVVLSLIGVLIISLWGKKNSDLEVQYLFAAFAVFIAALMGAIYTIYGKKLLERYSGFSLTIYATLFGYIGLIPLISPSLFNEVKNMSSMTWFAILFLAIFSSAIGYTIWYVVLEVKKASKISVYLYAIPVISTIVSFFWFNDEITYTFLLGGILVFAGLIIVNYKKQEKVD